MSAPLAGLRAWWLKLPLTEPYENALGALRHFDVMVLRLEDGDGRIGWGEACPVAGYSPETPAEAWEALNSAASALTGALPAAIDEWAAARHRSIPFVVSAIGEAMARMTGDPLLRPAERPVRVALAGTVNTLSIDEAPARAAALVAQGYRTLKVKVGYDPAADAARVDAIGAAIGASARIRADANQGYDRERALDFARRVRPAPIEVFEQPLPADQWAGLAEIARRSPLPLMLDESIYDEADVVRAAREVGAAAVKLKMSKAGGPAALGRQVERARALGLGIVVGNGVASDLGCLHEALCVSRLGVETAGELNGFLKPTTALLPTPLGYEAPHVVVAPGPLPAPVPERLERFAVERIGTGAAAD
ncbi:MAG: mandelate racemase/muconate lactonizing enzyme family protein [Alphaproteobacteria bacterium]